MRGDQRLRFKQRQKATRLRRRDRVRGTTAGVCQVQARHDRSALPHPRQQGRLTPLRLARMRNIPGNALESAAGILRLEAFGGPGSLGSSGLFLGNALVRAQQSLLEQRARAEENRMLAAQQNGLDLFSLVALADSHTLSLTRPRADLPEGVSNPPELCRSLRTIHSEELVGCVDIHRGARMPGEFLTGRLPPEEDEECGPSGCRAYLFNLAVAPNARRLGIADELLCGAHSLLVSLGVKVAYMHSETTNEGALKLYEEHHGYEPEDEEDEFIERSFRRQRRRLLRRSLNPSDETDGPRCLDHVVTLSEADCDADPLHS